MNNACPSDPLMQLSKKSQRIASGFQNIRGEIYDVSEEILMKPTIFDNCRFHWVRSSNIVSL